MTIREARDRAPLGAPVYERRGLAAGRAAGGHLDAGDDPLPAAVRAVLPLPRVQVGDLLAAGDAHELAVSGGDLVPRPSAAEAVGVAPPLHCAVGTVHGVARGGGEASAALAAGDLGHGGHLLFLMRLPTAISASVQPRRRRSWSRA